MNHLKKILKCAFDGRLPREASFYFYVPSRVDNTMAPSGKEVMNVIIRIPNLMSDEMLNGMNKPFPF